MMAISKNPRSQLFPFSTFLHRLARPYPEALHLSVQVASFDTEYLGRPRHVAVLAGERAQDVVAFELLAGFVQRERRGAGRGDGDAGRGEALFEEAQITRRHAIAGYHDHQP